MQLIERYIQAVKFWLPKAQQDDIAAELHANILSQAEDKEAELGRPLEEEEEVAILKQLGPPSLVAARYRQDQGTVAFGRQLIGPLIFPFYWVAVKAALCILVVLGLVIAATIAFQGDGNLTRQIAQAAWRFPATALPVLLLVTLFFVAVEFGLTKFRPFDNWDPRSLPPLDRQSRNVPRATSIAGIVVQLVFIVWWLGLPSFPDLIPGQLRLAPIWQTLYLPTLLIALAILAQHVATLVRPRWTWLPPAVGFVTSITALVVIYPFLQTQSLVALEAVNSTPLAELKIAKLNRGLHLAVLWTWIGILIVAIVEGVKCLRLGRNLLGSERGASAKPAVNGGPG